jgi:hypothetical protein
MARGMLFLILLVILVHETWSAKDGEHCAPSCGSIQNIRYPFALKGDPETCGDPRYRLSCEYNQTVLYLYAGKYNVREINYTTFIIRVSDSGIQENDNHSFIPHYFLRYENFTPGDPYVTEVPYAGNGDPDQFIQSASNYAKSLLSMPAVFVNCEKQVISSFYQNISACIINSSKRYRYIQLRTTGLTYVEDTCQVDQISLTTGMYSPENNISCSDVHNQLIYGFDLSWHQVYCGSCTGRDDVCYLDDANTVRCLTVKNGAQRMAFDKRDIAYFFFLFSFFFLFFHK